jgi:hypothetical protein
MKKRFLLVAAAALLAAGGLLAQVPQPPPDPVPPDPTQQPAPDQAGVEPLLRGPVHEAFAQPDTANPQPSPIIPKRPPDPIDEIPPDQKPEGVNVVWIPGYWAWSEDAGDFLWISGFWRDVPPDRQWLPGNWVAAAGGWQWIPGYWAPAGVQDVAYLPPPPQSLEAGPSTPPPQENMIYVPGIWIYQQTRYLWRPGFWVTAYPNWAYVPARYVWTPAGCVFVNGYWDYPLTRRGVLFCPVRFAPAVLARPRFYYQPNYAVSAPALLSSLFVATDFHRFQFGDYYGPQYVRRGVVPWFQYQVARGVVSPTFAHYRWEHRADPGWARNLERLYTERERGLAPRPAVTLAQQQRMIRNLTANKTVVVNGKKVAVANPQALVKELHVAAPITHVAKLSGVKLRAVPQAARTHERTAAMQIREAAAKRLAVEQRLVSEGHRPTRPTDKARTAKVELPRVTRPAAAPTKVQAPAAPRVPAHVERPLPKHEPAVPKRIAPAPEKRPRPEPKPRPEARPQPPAPRPTPATHPQPPATKPPPPAPATKPKPPAPQPMPAAHPQPPATKPQQAATRPQPPAPEAHPQPPAPRPAPATPPQPQAPRPTPAAHPQPPAPAAHPQPQAPRPMPAAQPPATRPATPQAPHGPPRPEPRPKRPEKHPPPH